MYSVFKYSTLNIPIKTLGNCRFIKDKLQYDYNRYKERMEATNDPAPNSHILVRLLRMLDAPLELDDVSFFLSLRERVKSIASTYGLVSIYSPGKSYGGRVFIMNNSEPFNIKDYKNINYLKYRYIPTIDFSYSNYLQKGFIEIDLIALGVGYRLWKKESLANDSAYLPNPGEFVNDYIIPNSIPSKHAISLMNYLYTNKIPEFFTVENNLGLLNPITLYKEVKRNFKKYFQNSNFRIGFPLYSVKCILADESLAKYLFINYEQTQLLNRYNSYIYWIYYSYYLTLMLEFHGEEAIRSNRYLQSEIKRGLQTLKYTHTVLSNDLDLKLIVEYTINILKKYLKMF